jgi:hypothetical protein
MTARGVDEGRDTRVNLAVDGNPFADTSAGPYYQAYWQGEQRTQTHTLTITAIDTFGNQTVQTQRFTVDAESPPPYNPGPPSSPTATPTRQYCPQDALPVRINTPVINATGAASVTVTGAIAGEKVELQGYSQNHGGTASFDNDPTPVDRSGTADANGSVTFSDLRPASNTRVRAMPRGCPYPLNAASSVISVRTQLTLAMSRTGVRRYVISGQSIPARAGGLVVGLYRVERRGDCGEDRPGRPEPARPQ